MTGMTGICAILYLRDMLDYLAGVTWYKVGVGPQRGLKFREESLTDHNLFALDQRCAGIEVYKFDHAAEAGNGADFEWFIGNGVNGWIGMRFQAKILDEGSYKELGHKVGGQFQYNLLLDGAANDGMWAFYCFYNGWDGGWPDNVRYRACGRDCKPTTVGDQSGCKHADLEDFGCALAPAAYVAHRHSSLPRRGRLELDDYLAFSRPWSHIFGNLIGVVAAQSEIQPILTQLAWTLRGWTGSYPSQYLDDQSADRDPARAIPDFSRAIPDNDGRRESLPQWLVAARAGEPMRTDARRPRVAVVVDLGALLDERDPDQ